MNLQKILHDVKFLVSLEYGGKNLNFKKVKDLRILRWQSVTEASAILIVITLLSKFIGYIRTMLIAYYFGVTAQVDAFVIAILIPSLILGIIGNGLQIVIIPFYTERKQKNTKKARIFVNHIFLSSLLIFSTLSILIFLFPNFFVKLVAYGFKSDRLNLASHYLRILVIFGFFNIFIALFIGLFQAEKQFLYPAAVTLFANMLIPASIILFHNAFGILSWALGEIAFAITGFTLMFIFLYKRKQFFHINDFLAKIDWKELREFFILVLPVILTSGIGILYEIVDKTVASSLRYGSVASLNYAQLIYRLPISLLVVPIVYAAYPSFSTFVIREKFENYRTMTGKILSFLFFLILPVSILIGVFSPQIIKLVFQHGKFSFNAIFETSLAVAMYAIGLVPLAFNSLFRNIFFSFRDTKMPLIVTIIAVVLNAIGDVVLSKFYGIGGIALTTSLVTGMGFFLYVGILSHKKYIPQFSLGFIFSKIIKDVIAGSIMFFTAIVAKQYVDIHLNFYTLLLRFIIISLALISIYLFTAGLLKSDGFDILITKLEKFKINFIGGKCK